MENGHLHERRPLPTFRGNWGTVDRGTLFPFAVSGFDIRYAVSVDGGLVFVVIRASDLVPSCGGGGVLAVLYGRLDGPTLGLANGGLAALQRHHAGFLMETEKEQHQDKDDGGDGDECLHDGCATSAG